MQKYLVRFSSRCEVVIEANSDRGAKAKASRLYWNGPYACHDHFFRLINLSTYEEWSYCTLPISAGWIS